MNQQSDGTEKQREQQSGGLLGRIRKFGDQATEALDQASGGRLRPGLDATKEKVSEVGNTVSGKKIQQQLEEFTDVVSTAVIGVHRDQRNLRDSLTQLRVQQTGLKLELCQVREEQSTVKEMISQVQQEQGTLQETITRVQTEGADAKEALAQIQAKQTEGNKSLAEVQCKQDTLTEMLEQLKDSVRQIEQPSRYPWWQFWQWRWI